MASDKQATTSPDIPNGHSLRKILHGLLQEELDSRGAIGGLTKPSQFDSYFDHKITYFGTEYIRREHVEDMRDYLHEKLDKAPNKKNMGMIVGTLLECMDTILSRYYPPDERWIDTAKGPVRLLSNKDASTQFIDAWNALEQFSSLSRLEDAHVFTGCIASSPAQALAMKPEQFQRAMAEAYELSRADDDDIEFDAGSLLDRLQEAYDEYQQVRNAGGRSVGPKKP